jgi:pSer/pThr/pTyr-binding forkhead associated (FHA) protein
MIKLQVIHDQTGESQEENLTPETLAQGGGLIGRHPGCDIVLDSREVSRVHARIIYREEQYYFTDLGSTGGSRVNTQEAATNENFLLKPNDIIRIGGFILLVKGIEGNGKGKIHQSQSTPTPVLDTKPAPMGRFIFKEEELKAQGLLNPRSSKLVFQGKRLVQGLSLSNRFRQKAIDLCQAELKAGKFCLLVEYSEHITLWQEEQVKERGNRTQDILTSDTQIGEPIERVP